MEDVAGVVEAVGRGHCVGAVDDAAAWLAGDVLEGVIEGAADCGEGAGGGCHVDVVLEVQIEEKEDGGWKPQTRDGL